MPAFFTIIAGSDHINAVRDGMEVITAWLRFQLGGEDERRSSFLDPQGPFSTGKYMTMTKNW